MQDAKGFGPYLLPEWNVSSVTTTDGVKNAVGVGVGVRSQDASGGVKFGEYYVGEGYNYLVVTVPLAVIGESYTYDDWNAQCVYESVQDVYLPYVSMSITREDNFGINATGTLYPGTPPITKAQNDIMGDVFWTGVEALLGGVPVGTWASMYQSYVTAAKAVGSPNIENFTQGSSSAGQQVIQSYDVTSSYWGGTGNSPTYNVFGPSMYVVMQIDPTDFSTPSTQPALTVYGENWINPQGSGCIAGQVQGANIPLDIFAYPAIEVEGTVSLGSRTLANQLLTLSDGGSNVYTFSTNSQGNYRFFAKPGTTYTLSTTYGSAQWQTSFTTGTDPSAEAPYENLNITAFSVSAGATPNPTQPGTPVSLWANPSGGYISPVTYSWNFGDKTTATGQDQTHPYSFPGTYQATVTATDSSNPVQTAQSTVNVQVNNPCGGSSACISPASQTVYYGICATPTATFAGFPAPTQNGTFTYSWAFGDGTHGSGQTVSHTYPYVQTTYTVTLTVTDSAGVKSTTTAKVTVKNMGKVCAPS